MAPNSKPDGEHPRPRRRGTRSGRLPQAGLLGGVRGAFARTASHILPGDGAERGAEEEGERAAEPERELAVGDPRGPAAQEQQDRDDRHEHGHGAELAAYAFAPTWITRWRSRASSAIPPAPPGPPGPGSTRTRGRRARMTRITHNALVSNDPKTASIGPPSCARTPCSTLRPPRVSGRLRTSGRPGPWQEVVGQLTCDGTRARAPARRRSVGAGGSRRARPRPPQA